MINNFYCRFKGKIGRLVISLSKNPRPSSDPYITGDGFRKMADHIYDETYKCNPDLIKERDIIFVKSEMLEDFFENIHPKINCKYKLISHNGDENITERYEKYLDDKIIHWFAQNLLFKNPKVTVLPIGLENLHYFRNGIISIFDKIQNVEIEKKDRVLVGFTVNTNFAERNVALDSLRECSCVDEIKNPLKSKFYLRLLNKYKFVASPPGNGIDCIRTWEALYLKTIPIVKNSINASLIKDLGLPVWIVNRYDELKEISEDELREKYANLMKDANWDYLKMDYWIKRIRNE